MRARATTIRATTDIFYKSTIGGGQQQQLFPASALRICDHHLHSSNIIPRIGYHPDNATNRIYEHDWFCVSQAVRCYDYNHNNAHTTTNTTTSTATASPLLHRVLSGNDDDDDDDNACYCDVWVDTESIGRSSIQFGGVVSIGRDVLAVVRRIFVRMNRPDIGTATGIATATGDEAVVGGTKSKPGPARFSDAEKERFCREFAFDALNISDNYGASDAERIRNLVDIPAIDSDSGALLLARIDALEASQKISEEESFRVSRVEVGPQHVNFGNHADHAFLAETAFHALVNLDAAVAAAAAAERSDNDLSVQYLAEVFLGDVLESYPYPYSHSQRPNKDDNNANAIILVATRKTTGERKVVLIAQSR